MIDIEREVTTLTIYVKLYYGSGRYFGCDYRHISGCLCFKHLKHQLISNIIVHRNGLDEGPDDDINDAVTATSPGSFNSRYSPEGFHFWKSSFERYYCHESD